MRDGGFDQVEVAVVFGALRQFMMVEIFQMLFAFEAFLPGPAFADLLEQDIPLGLVPVAARRFGAEVAEGIVRGRPAFQVPLTGLTVRPADSGAVFFKQGADGDMAVHRLQHFDAGRVEPDQREIVVEGREPVFVFAMLVCDKVGDVPGQERQRLAGQFQRFLDCGNGLHGLCVYPVGRRSLPERTVNPQDLNTG